MTGTAITFGWGGNSAVATFGWGEKTTPTPPIPVIVAHAGGGVSYEVMAEEEKEWANFIKTREPTIVWPPEASTVRPETETEIFDLRPALLDKQIRDAKEILEELTIKEKSYREALDELTKKDAELDIIYNHRRDELELMVELVKLRFTELSNDIKTFEAEKAEWESTKKIIKWDNWVAPELSIEHRWDQINELKEEIKELKEELHLWESGEPKEEATYINNYIIPPSNNIDVGKIVGAISMAAVTAVTMYFLYKMSKPKKISKSKSKPKNKPKKKKQGRRKRRGGK
jgi:hypothetical protein